LCALLSLAGCGIWKWRIAQGKLLSIIGILRAQRPTQNPSTPMTGAQQASKKMVKTVFMLVSLRNFAVSLAAGVALPVVLSGSW
jgi:hypothetical protein